MLLFVLIVPLLLRGSASAQEYMGCFGADSLDPDMISVSNGVNSPSECIEACRRQYYMYAGLMVTKCNCGSNFGRYGPSSFCTVNCNNAKNMLCGSYNATSVYTTGQKGPSPPRGLRIQRTKPYGLVVSWLYPDISNGNITSYTVRADAIESYSSRKLAPFESQVEGGLSNTTVLEELEPGTKYNVSVIATNTYGDSEAAYSDNWTYIGPAEEPAAPKILNVWYNTIEIALEEGQSESGPVSSYQVVVVDPRLLTPPMNHEQSYPNYQKSKDDNLGYYVTAAFDAKDFESYRKFTVGQGQNIGGYYNAPLMTSQLSPQVGLVVVSRIGEEVQYSYSKLASSQTIKMGLTGGSSDASSAVEILLWIGIVFLGALLVSSVVLYVYIRNKYEKGQKGLSEHQELTLQGPLVEVDNIAYIPEDIPESTNHYQELKKKVWTIPRNLLTIDSKLFRRGRFGTVHTGTVQMEGKMLPITVHIISDVSMKSSEKKKMLRELDLCIRAGVGANLAGLVGTCETIDTLFIALEMPTETLKNRLLSSRLGNPFPGEKIPQIGAAVASALQHLARLKIVHDFVCARSVGLDHYFNPKLMGHGIAKYSLEDIKFSRWTAVECFSCKTKHQPAAVWAFGVLLWEMFALGGTPYAHLSLESEVESAVENGERLPQLGDIPDPIYQVMISCWSIDTHERPYFDELVRLTTLSCLPVITSAEPYLPEYELNYHS